MNYDAFPLGDYPNVRLPRYLNDMSYLVNAFSTSMRMGVQMAMVMTVNPRPVKYYEQLIKRSLLMLIRYKTTIENGNYLFTANLKQLAKVLIERKYTLDEEEIKLLEGELTLLVLPIFGKEQEAEQCVNCPEYRYKLVNANELLYNNYPRLWTLVNDILLKEVMFDSKNPEEADHNSDKVDLSKFIEISKMKEEFTLTYVQGAEEVIVEVLYESDTPKAKDNFKLNLLLDVAKTQDGKATSVINKTIDEEDLEHHAGQVSERETYTYKFDFYNLSDSSAELKRDELDGLVYTRVSGVVVVDQESQRFEFPIKNHYDLIRYKLLITSQGGKLNIRVVDADFKIKSEIFKAPPEQPAFEPLQEPPEVLDQPPLEPPSVEVSKEPKKE
jgi:hypothetical protein